MVLRMADAPRSTSELELSTRVAHGSAGVVDCGMAPLEIPAQPAEALLITDFHESETGTAVFAPGAPTINVAESGDGQVIPAAARRRWSISGIFGAIFGFIAWLIRSLFGIASLILLLAVIA